MIVTVTKEDNPDITVCTGGEFAIQRLDIVIDKNIDIRYQRINVIHAILESFFRSVSHDKIDEVTQLIADGLDEL